MASYGVQVFLSIEMDNSSEPVDPEIEKAWEEEADRREAELQSGAAVEIPGPEALARLRAKHFPSA